MSDLRYPEPTLNKSASELLSQLRIYEDYIEHLRREIPAKCEEEGHNFGEPFRDDVNHWSNPTQDDNGDDKPGFGGIGSRPEIVDTETQFSILCSVCGKKVTKRAIETKTFTQPNFSNNLMTGGAE